MAGDAETQRSQSAGRAPYGWCAYTPPMVSVPGPATDYLKEKHMTRFQDRCNLAYQALVGAAEAGDMCPTCVEISDLCGYPSSKSEDGVRVFNTLIKQKRITSVAERGKRRIITIVATGKTTAAKLYGAQATKYRRMSSAEKGTKRSRRVGHVNTKAPTPTLTTHNDPKLLEAFRGLV